MRRTGGKLIYAALLLKFGFFSYLFGFYSAQSNLGSLEVRADLFRPQEDHSTDYFPELGMGMQNHPQIEVIPTFDTREANMLAFGDLLLDRYVRTLIQRNGMESILAGVSGQNGDFFDDYDFVFANLEGPVTPNRVPTGKSIAFQFSPEHLKILTDHHFNLVSVANNHVMDMGQQGYDDTYRILNEQGIVPVGDAKGVSEKSFYETQVQGLNFGFAAFNHTDYKLSIEEAVALIQDLKSRNDFVVVSIHWGTEYVHTPQGFQKEWARQMVEAGADVILGHHPHVLQGLEFVNGKPVFYSLGNFVFDQWFSEPTQETVALHLEFEKTGDERYLRLGLTPLRLNMALPSFPDEAMGQQIIDRFYQYSVWTNPDVENYRQLFETRWMEIQI